MREDGIPLGIAVFLAVIEGDGHSAAGLQKRQPRVNGGDGAFRHRENMRVPSGEASEIEDDGVHRSFFGVATHVGMAFLKDCGGKALFFKQGLGLFHRLKLDIKGQHLSLRSRKAAQKGSVPALACRCIDAKRPGADSLAQKLMDKA